MSWLLVTCAASMFMLCAIACDRYLYIVHPFLYERLVSTRSMGRSIAAVWVIAVLYGTMPFIMPYR
jgi:hypothetical protein